jgi:hypothetical protein
MANLSKLVTLEDLQFSLSVVCLLEHHFEVALASPALGLSDP